MAGKAGKCIHCGQRLTVPGGRPGMSGIGSAPAPSQVSASPNRASVSGISQSLFEATPEAMMRELFRRQQSALLLIFKPSEGGNYDLGSVPDVDLKCIATEDINQARFAQIVDSFGKRFTPRKRSQPSPSSSTIIPPGDAYYYELKGDRLGMTIEEFRGKYNRPGEGGQRLPLCSDTAWGSNKATLRTEPWHQHAKIIHARVDLPSEDNSPTVAGVKTELLLYHFIDGKLYHISAFFPTDQFHLVSEAAVKKYGQVARETQKPRQLIWENPLATVVLTRGTVHPRESSVLELVHKELEELAQSRAPSAAGDI
jgi:hypothetical protein